MSIKVFWISGSAPAWRVLLALEFKKLEYQSRVLENSKREQKASWFLEISPRGQVPVIQHGDVTVSESQAILQYLDAICPDPPLFGNDPKTVAEAAQGTQEILSYVDPAVSGFVQPVFRGKTAENRDEIQAKAVKIQNELKGMEIRIGESGWLRQDFGIMDIVFIPTLQRLLRAVAKAPDLAGDCELDRFSSRYPKLADWNKRTESLAAFRATFPPHWKE